MPLLNVKGILFLYVAGLLIGLTPGCHGSEWQAVSQMFPDSLVAGLHLHSHASTDLGHATWFQDAPELDTAYERRLQDPKSSYSPRAAFKFEISPGGYWGLVCHVEPGEASSHWGYRLLPFDPKTAEYGASIPLSMRMGECTGEEILESWIKDLDHDGDFEILLRSVSYQVPDPQGEYCQDGWSPVFRSSILEFRDGKFLTRKMDAGMAAQYKLSATADIRANYENAGFGHMLPTEWW